MAAKKGQSKINKAEFLRSFFQEHGTDMKPVDIVKESKKLGVMVTPSYASNAKFTFRSKQGKQKAARPGRKPAAAHNGQSAKIPVDHLVQAKRLADTVGGVEKAIEAVNVLSKLT